MRAQRRDHSFSWRSSIAAVAVLLLGAVPALAQSASDQYYSNASYEEAPQEQQYTDVDAGGYETSYSYVRNLSGSATLIQADGERGQLDLNQPVLVGDRVWVSPDSRVELLLSDGNLLRIDGDSEVRFDALAYSPEANDESTVLRVDEGNLVLVVTEGSVGKEFPRVELANATVYVGETGRYRLTTAGGDWSQVVARRGWVEVVTDRGSEVVRAGREALVEGARAPRLALAQAGDFDALERWGERLDTQVADHGYVDDSLRYSAAPLDDYGSWVTVESRRAWRPRVGSDWRPYQLGRWRSTPIGLTWISSEPWGWAPYHYGTWDYVPGHGWVWFPGSRFAPAWVYWYWGNSHTAWVPVGYYTRHYPRYRSGFRHGVYGWAGGDWGLFGNWILCPTRYIGLRNQHRYAHDGHYWKRNHGGHGPGRGLITTDTRGIQPRNWHDPGEVQRVLQTRPGNRGRAVELADLPDVTPFVARRDLPGDVERRVINADPVVGRRTAGSPLVPSVESGGGRGRAGLARPRVAEPRSGATADGETGIRPVRGAGGATDGPRVVTPRGTSGRTAAPNGGGLRPTAPRGGDRPVRVVRPRTVEPESSPSTPARPARPSTTVRGRTDSPRAGSDGGAASGGERPRVVTPRAVPRSQPAQGSSPRVSTPQGDAPRRPTAVRGRPSGSDRPSTTQRERGDDGDGLSVALPSARRSAPRAASPRATAPRGSASSHRTSTPRVATPSTRSPRVARPSTPSTRSGAAQPQAAPRRDRAGADSAPPARRVVRSAPRTSTPSTPRASAPRSSAPRSGAPRASAPRASTPTRSAPRASAPRRSAPRSATPRASTPQRSAPRSSTPRASTPSTSRRSSSGTVRGSSRSGSSNRSSASSSSRSGSSSSTRGTARSSRKKKDDG